MGYAYTALPADTSTVCPSQCAVGTPVGPPATWAENWGYPTVDDAAFYPHPPGYVHNYSVVVTEKQSEIGYAESGSLAWFGVNVFDNDVVGYLERGQYLTFTATLGGTTVRIRWSGGGAWTDSYVLPIADRSENYGWLCYVGIDWTALQFDLSADDVGEPLVVQISFGGATDTVSMTVAEVPSCDCDLLLATYKIAYTGELTWIGPNGVSHSIPSSPFNLPKIPGCAWYTYAAYAGPLWEQRIVQFDTDRWEVHFYSSYIMPAAFYAEKWVGDSPVGTYTVVGRVNNYPLRISVNTIDNIVVSAP